jgi:hypothetical protein
MAQVVRSTTMDVKKSFCIILVFVESTKSH